MCSSKTGSSFLIDSCKSGKMLYLYEGHIFPLFIFPLVQGVGFLSEVCGVEHFAGSKKPSFTYLVVSFINYFPATPRTRTTSRNKSRFSSRNKVGTHSRIFSTFDSRCHSTFYSRPIENPYNILYCKDFHSRVHSESSPFDAVFLVAFRRVDFGRSSSIL